MFEPTNVLYDEPVEELREKISEMVNRARWTGNWSGILNADSLKDNYDNVPDTMKEDFNNLLGQLDPYPAFSYQKFDAAIAALKKTCMLTHTMGLGKTRIVLLASRLINRPTLVVALPRLIKTVWANELALLGIDDWVVIERPKPSKREVFFSTAEGIEDLRGLRGIGRISLRPVQRDNRCTADATSPEQVKIISYNMTLPVHVNYDYVICQRCGYKHNQENCPSLYVDFSKYQPKKKDLEKVEILKEKYRKKLINVYEAYTEIREIFCNDTICPRVEKCNSPLKGSICPVCHSKMLNNKKPSHLCNRCGYSARIWIPSVMRRLGKNIDIMILDESQAVKNSQSLRSQYTLSLRPKYRFLTSGTPATAHLAPDLYHQLRWLLGKGIMFPYEYKSQFVFDIDRTGDEGIKKLHSLLDPVQIRRDTDEYGVVSDVDLPPVKERRFSISLSDIELENYERASDNIREWLTSIRGEPSELDLFSKMWILRRAACVPWIDNPAVTKSTKLEALRIEVESFLSQGKKILIGTEMLDMLDAICGSKEGVARIDGSVPIRTADRIISLFQEVCPECNLGLVNEFGNFICPLCEKRYDPPKILAVSRKAVREGVTLNKASVVILTDPSWTYAEMIQFWKRAHRIGAVYDCLNVIYMGALCFQLNLSSNAQ